MAQRIERLKETPSQTAGPYVHIGCMPNFLGNGGNFATDLGAQMLGDGAKGQRITVKGRILDATNAPVKDAMIEVWQADAAGLFNSPKETRGTPDPAFAGFGRFATDFDTGTFTFDTIKPGRVPWRDGTLQAPHIAIWIVARGINLGLHTRMYFEDEREANREDPVLRRIEHRKRVPSLLAEEIEAGQYRFDIRLQGHGETIFFDI
ncbi:MAG: protocatechuate 3,4-dioxygenase subunit alpha [Brevirhabdus sp.]